MSLLISEGTVREALREVYDPELGVNVVDLGLIYAIDVDGALVRVTMTLTTPGCPLHDTITEAVNEAVGHYIPGVEGIQIDLVWEPRWSPEMMTEAGRREIGWW
ncbi:MAG TPA: metal-sulfur cluster assembly factor [Thermomicrobiales bacterium]|nr:metal-sulfur cluster assembly factor [Thermomicrobiales bacterium]